ncbi:hypothetical protein [Pseudomonas sp. MBLB4136]|uniref:hypothetical protein n=1 Tax=Pseudomonas sp. MBLB4136 TaxID=3451558 RepID=UPI003F750BF7
MHRIDAPSATVDNKFTEGSPSGGVPATVLTAEWLNDIQENLAALIEGAGIALTKGRALDLLDAIQALITAIGATAVANINGRYPLPGGFLLQWGRVAGPASPANNRWDGAVTFPVALTQFAHCNAHPAISVDDLDSVSGAGGGATLRTVETHMITSRPLAGGFEFSVFYKVSPTDARSVFWWAVGKP